MEGITYIAPPRRQGQPRAAADRPPTARAARGAAPPASRRAMGPLLIYVPPHGGLTMSRGTPAIIGGLGPTTIYPDSLPRYYSCRTAVDAAVS
eukprot:SAG31_NODE_453_length_15464_cov_37.074064_15_plen_93_part_00